MRDLKKVTDQRQIAKDRAPLLLPFDAVARLFATKHDWFRGWDRPLRLCLITRRWSPEPPRLRHCIRQAGYFPVRITS